MSKGRHFCHQVKILEEMGNLAVDSVMANNEPDDDALEACKALGAALA